MRTFSSITRLKDHIQRDHWTRKKKQREISEPAKLVKFSLKCEFAHCGEIHQGKKKLLEHYKISHKKEIKPCLHEGCNTTVQEFSSLLWHIKKKHDGGDHDLKKEIVCGQLPRGTFPIFPEESRDEFENCSDCEDQSASEEEETSSKTTYNSVTENAISEEQFPSFELGYADFLNRLLSYHYIPMTALVKINSEIAALVGIVSDTKNRQFVTEMQAHNISTDVTEDITNSLLRKQEAFQEIFDKFRTARKAESYFMENFACIQPKTVKLGKGSFQYINIIETLKAVTRDKTFQKYQNTGQPSKEDAELLVDIHDGSSFKESEFFRANPGALK
jgi:hypothetical protein